MDVKDKTRFVFPVPKSSKDASPSINQIHEGSDGAVFDENDLTVFVESQNNKTSNYSHFSIGSSVDNLSNSPDAFQGESYSDATVFYPQENHPRKTHLSRPPVSISIKEVRSSSVQPNPKRVVIKNRFELMDLLGVGGMGAVYKASDRRKVEASDNDPYVAIKVLNDDFKNHPDAFISLQREARKSQTLAHPNIVNVHDFDRDGEMVFMTMEFLEGSPLDAILRERAGIGLPFDQAKVILKDISNALIYAHSHHIVHSDFKPGNIFVTNTKGAKVFDFGISRAINPSGTFVSNSRDSEGTKTVFDAASLGALTPAYASLEMLLGKEPSPSDDVYALACVAFELFCGKHPFNKTPADKAREQKLQLKRIKGLSGREWKALVQGLEFTREKRTPTVDEFVSQFFGRRKTPAWLVVASLITLSAGGGFYGIKYTEKVVDEQGIKEELQVELQLELMKSRISDKKISIERLLAMDSLSESWESDIRQEVEDYQALAPEDAEMTARVEAVISEKYINAAKARIKTGEYAEAESLLVRSERWTENSEAIVQLQRTIEGKIKEERLAVIRKEEEDARRLRDAEAQRLRDRNQKMAEKRTQEITAVLARIEGSLRCSSSMDIDEGLAENMKVLAGLDESLYLRVVPDVALELKQCLLNLEKSNPQRAELLLQASKALFPSQPSLQTMKIDHCVHLQPGSGSRGDRFSCQDNLSGGYAGPKLVVIKTSSGKKVAIGKYETTTSDFSIFCKVTNACSGLESSKSSIPIHNVSIEIINQYLSWLSMQSGYRYRLPTEDEWLSAAKPNGQREDPDRNCHLRFGAIQKGDELVAAEAGKSNSQGLINQVGNVQELATTSQGELVALGGSREDSMSRCLTSTRRDHQGVPDATTGFRVLRAL